ncbi:MAG TPA: class A beta-lactamase-related serine hydrolase [Verrucomicrobiales bacterium]|nr:class A beta-lactamase-related serine hydrolase [Verrucomicrobiales bacterium]
MIKIYKCIAIVLSLVFVCSGILAQEVPQAGDRRIAKILVQMIVKHDVPALAGVIVTSDGKTISAVAGYRKKGETVGVTLQDKWHLGSDTKSMTAMLIGMLVDADKLKWETTLEEVFPQRSRKWHAQVKKITMLQLLSHRAGLKANLSYGLYPGTDVKAIRELTMKCELSVKPDTKPGSTYLYSNWGYIIAGGVIEKITGKSWNNVIQAKLFKPLGMSSAGFGGLGTLGQIDQPWPHGENGKPIGSNGPLVDNPPVLGPAGRVHCTMEDWAKFIADQLRGVNGQKALIKQATYQNLHTPPFEGNYAMGWKSLDRPWGGGGKVLTHSGSNTMNYCTVWIVPKRDFAVLIACNQGGAAAAKACDDVAGGLIRMYDARNK